MRALSLLTFVVAILLLRPVQAQSYADFVQQKLDEAEDYLAVNPARSLQILDELGPIYQPDDSAIHWHLLLLRAALPTHHLDRMLTALEVLFGFQQHPLFLQNIATITSGTGIWLRRHLYVADAKISLECALKYAKDNKQRLTLQNSMGLISRELGDAAAAQNQFQHAFALAHASNNIRVAAMVENNLGLLAMESGRYAQAAAYFRSSLTRYQSLSQRSGQISAALNLMMVFLIQGDTEQYQRLYGPTATLTENFPNKAKQALLLWLSSYFEKLNRGTTSTTPGILRQAFYDLETVKLQQSVLQHLAPALELNLPLPPSELKVNFARPWFNKVKKCDWPHLTPATAV